MRAVSRKMAVLSFVALFGPTAISAETNKQVLQHRQSRQLQEEDLLELSRFLEDIQDQQVEDVFRRLQTGSSFLNDHLTSAVGGHGTYYGSTTTSAASQAYAAADFAMPQAHGKPPKSNKAGSAGDNGGGGLYQYSSNNNNNNNNNGKGKKGKSGKSEKSKKHKKAKKHRSEKKNIDKKLAKDGYFDDDYWENYDDYEQVYDTAEDSWHYNDWAWEYDEEYLEEEEEYHQASSSWIYEREGSYYRAGGSPGSDGLGSNLNRFGPSNTAEIPHSAIDPASTNQTDVPQNYPDLVYADDMFDDDSNSTDDYFDFDDIRPQGRTFGNVAGDGDGPMTKQLQLPEQEFLPQMDYDGPPMRFKFPFPIVEHRVYSGPVLLKAHSATDLSELDPEIFAVLQSVLTPYLQEEVGTTLKAYTLEVDYTPGDDKIASGTIVTNLQVTVTLKVVSDSIESLTSIDHTQVSEWIHDFFAGPELNTFLVALQENNINVREMVFIDQEFKAGGKVIAGISDGSGGGGGNRPSNTESSGGGGSAAVIIITMSTLLVGAVLFLHFTGRLPSKEQMHHFGENSKERLHAFGHTLRTTIGKNDRDDDLGDPLEDLHNVEEGGRKQRERTWSGTFRRYPEGGIRPAAIQKQPAMSQDYLGDSSSKGSSSSSSSSSGPPPKQLSRKDWKSHTEVSAVYDDYSFSAGGDFSITGSPVTPSRSSRRSPTSPAGSDEFTMPDDYDTVHEDETASLYSKWSHSVNVNNNRGTFGMSPLPPSPRRVMPSDMASPPNKSNETWSLGSFDLQTPSARQLYRDFMGSADQGSTSSSDKSPKSSKFGGLSIPKFT